MHHKDLLEWGMKEWWPQQRWWHWWSLQTLPPSLPAAPGRPCSPGGPGDPGWPLSPVGPVSPDLPYKSPSQTSLNTPIARHLRKELLVYSGIYPCPWKKTHLWSDHSGRPWRSRFTLETLRKEKRQADIHFPKANISRCDHLVFDFHKLIAS